MSHATDTVVERPRRHRPALALGGLALVVAAVAAYLLLRGDERVLRVERGHLSVSQASFTAFRDEIPLRGKVVPRDVVVLDAATGGRIERVHVEAGDLVQAGQPLMELSNTSLQMQVIQQESQLNQALSQLQTNEITLEQNRLNNERALATLDFGIQKKTRLLERAEALRAQGFVSQAEVDRLRDELEDDRRQRPLQVQSNRVQDGLRSRQLPLIQVQQAQLKKSLDMVRSKLDELIVRAPIAGKVTDLDLKIGESRAAGEHLATLVPDTGIKVSAKIDEYFLDRVRVNQKAQVEIDGTPWQLNVSRVYPQVKDGTFGVDLVFEASKPPAGMLPGQAILGRLSLGANTKALVVDAGSYLEHSGGFLFVLDPEGHTARRRPVRLGRRTIDQVEVIEGLKPGEKVVTSDYGGFEGIDKLNIR